jgi:hypothetical protein
MDEFSPEDLSEARRALSSLRSKSEKAAGKLKDGSWQERLTTGIVNASDVALRLIDGGTVSPYDQDALAESHAALKDALRRAEEVIVRFAAGTSQHTLQKNRVAALRIALALIEKEQG